MEQSPLVTALTEAKKSGTLKFSLPVSGHKIEMCRSTGRHQLIAQKLYDPAKNAYQFMMECIRLTATVMPKMPPTGPGVVAPRQFNADELLDLCNEDLDVIHECYSRFNRTGKYSVTDTELDAFFGSH